MTLEVKLMQRDACSIRRMLRSILCYNIIIVVLCVELSIVCKLKSIKIRESLSIAPRIGYIVNAIVLIGWAAIINIINVT